MQYKINVNKLSCETFNSCLSQQKAILDMIECNNDTKKINLKMIQLIIKNIYIIIISTLKLVYSLSWLDN